MTLLGSATTAMAAVRGFNYGAQGQSQAQFEASFKTAASLQGASDFTSARLYTMIQEGTTNGVIDAIPAALDTKTTLLLGLWASSPQAQFDNEIAALKKAISTYGSDLANAVVGISVGSEDLYRISVTGIANDPLGVGQDPKTLVSYISQVRDAIKGTVLSGVPIVHVDTWNAFVNSSNNAVASACDFLGLDEYPYYQTTDKNGIENGKSLFFEAYDKVAAAAPGKQIWVTEAGWPVSGPKSGDAVASVDNAEIFWQDVACELETRGINFWWYILQDSVSPSFSVSNNGVPLYDLSCNASSTANATKSVNGTSSSSSTNGTSSSTSSSSGSKSSSTGSSGSGSSSATGSGSASSATATGGVSPASSSTATRGAASASVSSYTSAADKVQIGAFGLFVAGVIAAFAL